MYKEKAFRVLCLWLGLKVVTVLGISLWLGLALSPDEAQYWVWSQDLAWGYYSKPPGIAWQIALSTFLLGSHAELVVRLGAVFWSVGSSVLLYMTARRCELTPWGSFWAAFILAISPIGMLGSFAATTDVGMLFFWIGSLYTLANAHQHKKPLPILSLGLWIFAGALFKWAIYWIYLPLLFWPCKNHKKHLLRLLVTFLISLFALLPSLYWNFSHHFVTFKHVLGNIEGGRQGGEFFFFEFVGAQLGLFSPFFSLLLVAALYVFWTKPHLRSTMSRWHAGFFLTFFSVAASCSLWGKLQANWFLFIYPSAALSIGYFLDAIKWRRYFIVASGLTMALVLFALSLPKTLEKLTPLPYQIHPFLQCEGWQELAPALNYYGFDPQNNWLFADTYQMTSLLSYYSPNKTRAYFFNLRPTRQNQYSFDVMPTAFLNQDAYFVVAEKQSLATLESAIPIYLEKLQPFFSEVKCLGSWPLVTFRGIAVKNALIFKGHHYLGTRPQDPSRY